MDYVKLEKEVFDYINNIRVNPKIIIFELKDRWKYYSGKIYNNPDNNTNIITSEGIDAVEDCIVFFNKQEPIDKFSISEGLNKAAKDHCEDIGFKGLISHNGTDSSEPNDRMEKYGRWNIEVSENISFGMSNARDIILQLLIDDGIKSRNHRLNLMNPKSKYIGISCGYHKVYENCCIIDFAVEYKELENNNLELKAKDPIQEPNFDERVKNIEEEDWPENAVRCQIKKQTKINGLTKIIKITKIYTLNNGEEEIIENTIEEKIK